MSGTMPTFLIIGTQKGGTTALYQMLRQHPQVFMSPNKEPSFFAYMERKPLFDGPLLPRSPYCRPALTLEQYEAIFAWASLGQARGEASTHYSICWTDETARNIHRLIPNVRLIAILRQPAERAYSAFNMMRRKNQEPIADFQSALEAEQSLLRANWMLDFHYFENGLYYKKLKPYFDLFPRDHIRIYLYEEWNSRPADVIVDICGFLGVDENHSLDFSERYNESYLPRISWLETALHKPTLLRPLTTRLLPRRLRQQIKHVIEKINRTRPPRLSPALHSSLTERYREDITALQHLIERDLTQWLTPKG
jgi:hypothetical protein